MPVLLVALLLLGAALVVVLLFLVLLPLSLVQRYRVGTARRPARGWVATVNLVSVAISALLFLLVAGITGLWVPNALRYGAAGLLAGCLLGFLGVATSRWEATPGALHYTPNRWLVLAITLLVAARLAYGVWRGWYAWRVTPGEESWLAVAGVAGSLGAGAVVIGYYLTYWAGVRRRFRRHAPRLPSRTTLSG